MFREHTVAKLYRVGSSVFPVSLPTDIMLLNTRPTNSL